MDSPRVEGSRPSQGGEVKHDQVQATLVTAFFGATSDQLVILDGPGLLAEAAAAPAHIGCGLWG